MRTFAMFMWYAYVGKYGKVEMWKTIPQALTVLCSIETTVCWERTCRPSYQHLKKSPYRLVKDIGKETCTMESLLIGITEKGILTSQCPTIFQSCFNNLVTRSHTSPTTAPSKPHHEYMVRRHRTPQCMMNHPN